MQESHRDEIARLTKHYSVSLVASAISGSVLAPVFNTKVLQAIFPVAKLNPPLTVICKDTGSGVPRSTLVRTIVYRLHRETVGTVVGIGRAEP